MMLHPRIAHLIESDGPGGAEQVVVHLARELQASGVHNVAFLPAAGEGWLADALAGSGVAIEHFRLERPLSPPTARALALAFQRHGITLAHSHEFSMAVYGAWAARQAGLPHVITMHGSRYYAARFRRRLALRAAVALSARTVAVSETLARQMRRDLWLGASRVTVVPNGVRPVTPPPTSVRAELGLQADDRLLVAVGNLYPVKGHQYLIDALALLARQHPRLHLAIAGRGELADALAARARQHEIGRRVHLLGLRADIPAVLAAADVFVLPSLSEGVPLALLEAMFAGCAIVASDVGDIGVVLAHGEAGVLVEAGRAEALAVALDAILSDPARQQELRRRAARRAATEYDVATMVHRYRTIYARAGGLTPDRSYPPLGRPAEAGRHRVA